MEETSAKYITFFDSVKLDIVVKVVVEEESEQQHAIDVDQDELEHCCHKKLTLVYSDGTDHISQRGEAVNDIEELHRIEHRRNEETQKRE
jgi:hypothetical protein